VITEDVEAGALAIARPRQTTKPGYAARVDARRKDEQQ
jgi:bifunctional N-acetylglucosamine-1-phosphate-uridyltransferase/glucosamine-1-phosphate-acetyltransferase GlmU-like protein